MAEIRIEKSTGNKHAKSGVDLYALHPWTFCFPAAGWLVGYLGFNGALRQFFILYRPSFREREKEEI